MPRILYEQGFNFSFYASDGQEPPHVHVFKGGQTAKWWLDPVAEQYSHGFTFKERAAIRRLVLANRLAFVQRWHAFFPPH
jgi:hypothetical protein